MAVARARAGAGAARVGDPSRLFRSPSQNCTKAPFSLYFNDLDQFQHPLCGVSLRRIPEPWNNGFTPPASNPATGTFRVTVTRLIEVLDRGCRMTHRFLFKAG